MTPLEQAINNLGINPNAQLGVMQLVNCDRVSHIGVLMKNLNTIKDKNAQFYFLCGCSSQKPLGLAERMVYEIIRKGELVLDKSICYRYNYDDTEMKRLEIGLLPFNIGDLEGSKKAFKKDIEELLHLNDCFDSFITEGIPKSNYAHVAVVYEILQESWEDDFLLEYLTWIIETFRKTSPHIPVFHFVFVVHLKGYYATDRIDEKNVSIVSLIRDNYENEEKGPYVFTELTPIEPRYVEDWLKKLDIGTRNKADNFVQILTQYLTNENKLVLMGGETKFNMRDIEDIQHDIVMTYRNKSNFNF